jgi:hypothetical protein
MTASYFLFFSKGDQIREDEMHFIRNTLGGCEKPVKNFSWKKPKGDAVFET